MQFYKPGGLTQCLDYLKNKSSVWLLAGGTDINIQIKNKQNIKDNVVLINHLKQLHIMKYENHILSIGAAVTIKEISDSPLIKRICPFLTECLQDFASPLIANLATLAGNIANSSPTADSVPPLLVLEAKLLLQSSQSSRKIPLCRFYTGYKKFVMLPDEMITAVEIPLLSPEEYSGHYIKIASRPALSIAKASLAMLKTSDKFILAAGSLSPFPKRLYAVEKLLNENIEHKPDNLRQAFKEDVKPISDFRSTASYRFDAAFNMLKKFVNIH